MQLAGERALAAELAALAVELIRARKGAKAEDRRAKAEDISRHWEAFFAVEMGCQQHCLS